MLSGRVICVGSCPLLLHFSELLTCLHAATADGCWSAGQHSHCVLCGCSCQAICKRGTLMIGAPSSPTLDTCHARYLDILIIYRPHTFGDRSVPRRVLARTEDHCPARAQLKTYVVTRHAILAASRPTAAPTTRFYSYGGHDGALCTCPMCACPCIHVWWDIVCCCSSVECPLCTYVVADTLLRR